MVIIIKKVILCACFSVLFSNVSMATSFLTSVPAKDGFNCKASCTKRTCSSQLTTATACVAWCAPEDYGSCWQSAVNTINFQKTLSQNNIDSPTMRNKPFLKRYETLVPITKSNLYSLFEKALEMAQLKNKKEPIPDTLTKATAELRLSAGPPALEELRTIHDQEQKELRNVFTRVP